MVERKDWQPELRYVDCPGCRSIIVTVPIDRGPWRCKCGEKITECPELLSERVARLRENLNRESEDA